MTEQPRRRRGHRRVVRPATGGEAGPEPRPDEPDPTDKPVTGDESAERTDRWWQEQRPPHWE